MKKLYLLFSILLFQWANAYDAPESKWTSPVVGKIISDAVGQIETSCNNFITSGENPSDCFSRLRNQFSLEKKDDSEIMEICKFSSVFIDCAGDNDN